MLGQVGLAGCVLAAVELLTAGFNLTQKQGSMLISWQAVNWGHNAEISWKAKHLLGTCIIPGSAGVTQSLNWSTSFHWALFYSFFLSFFLSLSLLCVAWITGAHMKFTRSRFADCVSMLSHLAPRTRPSQGKACFYQGYQLLPFFVCWLPSCPSVLL